MIKVVRYILIANNLRRIDVHCVKLARYGNCKRNLYTEHACMHFVSHEDHTEECECKIAHVCLKVGRYLFQEVEVDLQNFLQNSDLKQQPLQVLTKQQAAEEAS